MGSDYPLNYTIICCTFTWHCTQCPRGAQQSAGKHPTGKTMRFIKYATQKWGKKGGKQDSQRQALDLTRDRKCGETQERGANEGWTHLWSEMFYFLSLCIYRNRRLLWQRDDRTSIAIRSTVGKMRPRSLLTGCVINWYQEWSWDNSSGWALKLYFQTITLFTQVLTFPGFLVFNDWRKVALILSTCM